MFNLSEWLRTTMADGVCKGQVSLVFTAVKAADFLSKGIFTQDDVEYVALNAIEPTVQTDEITEEQPETETE